VSIPSINLECSELGDEDLNELAEFLKSHSAVKSFSYAVIADTESDEPMTEDTPVIGLVNLTAQRWNAVTRGVAGKQAQEMAGEWVALELEPWCADRNLFARYDPEYNLIPIQP